MINCTYTYIGYHGTSNEAYAQIKTNGFGFNKRKDHWLGQGTYFFLDDYEQAKWFSNQCKLVKYKKEKPCVLQTLIKVKHDKILNVDTTRGRYRFKKSLGKILKLIADNNIEFENLNEEQEIKCIICSSFDDIKDVDVILKVFLNSEKSDEWLEDSAKYNEPTHTQICVRKRDCIKHFKKIKGEYNYGT